MAMTTPDGMNEAGVVEAARKAGLYKERGEELFAYLDTYNITNTDEFMWVMYEMGLYDEKALHLLDNGGMTFV